MTINRRTTLSALTLLAAAAMLSTPALSFEMKTFDQKAFEAARAANKPVLIHVTAPWCPTCRAQKPILASLGDKARFKGVAAFEIDFDSQKDALRALGVRSQSTIIVFRGATEAGRSAGDTTSEGIEALMGKAI